MVLSGLLDLVGTALQGLETGLDFELSSAGIFTAGESDTDLDLMDLCVGEVTLPVHVTPLSTFVTDSNFVHLDTCVFSVSVPDP